MNVRLVRLAEETARVAPGAPYYAFAGPLPGTGQFRADYLDVVAVASGEGRRVSQDADGARHSSPLLPGQMYLFRPSEVHEMYSVSPETMTVLNVAFPVGSWERFADLANLDRTWSMAAQPPMVVVDLERPDIARAFARALERFGSGPKAIDLIEFLAAIVPLFVPADPAADGGGAPAWLRDVLTAMTDERNLRGGVERLKELAGKSSTHLWRTTRRHLGLSPTELVRVLQLRHAAVLLRATNDSVRSIGERCGFSSTAYFSNVFRRHHLSSPRAYRELAWGGSGAGGSASAR